MKEKQTHNFRRSLCFVSLTFLLLFLGKQVYSCNPCGGAGRTWCDCPAGKKYKCASCSGSCYQWGSFVITWRSNCCPRRDSQECDTSCCPPNARTYTKSNGSCSCSPSCGDIVVKPAGGTDPTDCSSGSIDVYLSGVVNATSVWFPSWTGVGGQDDLVWYKATNQGGGVWKATIDLRSHAGIGAFNIHAYVRNSSTPNKFCDGVTITKAPLPDCPQYLYINHQCGATNSKATFSWGDYYWGSMVKPNLWVLRVDYDDNVDPEWMTDHDYWKYVPNSVVHPNAIGACGWTFMGVWECVATLDSTTLSKGGYPFTPGYYNWWSIQAVDDCGNYSNQCSVSKGPFDCVNQAPTCTAIVGPATLLYGSSGTYTSRISDPTDPVNYNWYSKFVFWYWSFWAQNGFSPKTGTGSLPYTDISTVYTPLNEFCYDGDSTQIRLSITDTALSTSCFKNISLRSPNIVGTIYDATNNGCGGTLTPLPYLASGAALSFKVTGYADRNNIGVNTTTGTYTFPTSYGVTSTLYSIYLEENDIDHTKTPLDTTLKTKCVETACTVGGLPVGCTSIGGLNVGSGLTAVGSYAIPGDVTINIGYKLTSTLHGWFTVLDGDIYDGSGFVMIVPQEPKSYDSYLTNSFALSSGLLNIKDSASPQRVRISGKGYGYPTASINLAVLPSDLPANAGLKKITSLSNLDPSVVYYMEKSALSSALSNDLDYSSKIASNGVVVIKTDGSINFTRKFYSTNRNRKILFVTDDTVTFKDITAGINIPNGSGSDLSRIDVGIFTLDNINFPSTGSENGDLTLVINGILISGDTINFNRDRKLQNSYPGVAVHFDPAYVYYLQKQMLANPVYAEKIMSLVDISWDIEN